MRHRRAFWSMFSEIRDNRYMLFLGFGITGNYGADLDVDLCLLSMQVNVRFERLFL